MNRLLKISCSLLACMALLILNSCSMKEDEDVNFNEAMLYGKWQSGTLFEVYKSDLTGYTWDTKDDVKEEEAQMFSWSLTEDNLVQIHIMEAGGKVPKSFTVTSLTETQLVYVDEFDNSITFNKADY